jgi:hypothetical protein
MSALTAIADAIANSTHPACLYVQRHVYMELLDALDVSYIDTMFGMPVVWVQHADHPLVRVYEAAN